MLAPTTMPGQGYPAGQCELALDTTVVTAMEYRPVTSSSG